MASRKILKISYAHEATIVRRRHRIEETVLLRDTMHVEIPELSAEEAHVRLTASLSNGPDDDRSTDIVLRHDGTSYLRPVARSPKRGSRPAKPFTIAELTAMTSMTGSPPPLEKDAPRSWLTTGTVHRHFRHSRIPAPAPGDIPTAASISADVRSWVNTGAAEAQRAVVAEAAQYVLVDDHLHRRTTAPLLAWINFDHDLPRNADAFLTDGVDFFDMASALGYNARWWPISHADAFLAAEPSPGWRLSVDAPLETDRDADIVMIGRTILPRIDHYLPETLPELSDAGLDLYKTYRRAREAALGGDAEAMISAMDAARLLAMDGAFKETARNNLNSLSSVIGKQLPHWDMLLRSSGVAMDNRDEAAILAFAR